MKRNRFTMAATLALGILAALPGAAFAQAAHGSFTLTHTVHWQNAIVPEGTYRFTITAKGPADMLTLTRISSPGAGFMFIVPGAEDSKPGELSQLILVKTTTGSFVSEMELPEYGMTLRFSVPAEPIRVAQASSGGIAAAQ